MVLLGFPTTSFPHIEEITNSPISSVSHDSTQQIILLDTEQLKRRMKH